jgi:glycosyltransferase involved in cell wall biosynthesis
MRVGPAHVALNAQLLFGPASYRSAGIHHYIDCLLRGLPEAGPDLRYTVFVGAGQPQMPGATIRRTALPTARPWARILWEQVLQPIELMRLRPDLLHSLAFVSPFRPPCPAVVTVYDLSFKLTPDRFPPAQRLYLSAFTARSCHRARRVIAISESTRSDVVRLFGVPRSKVDVAYPGIGEAFRPLPAEAVAAFRAAHKLPERFILYLGTLEPRKNVDALVRAFAEVRRVRRAERADAGNSLHLVLAGARGWWFEDLFRLIQSLDLADSVHLPGYVPEAELPLWYNAAAAFVYPSSYEGFGLPVAEALACGRPVVTTTASSLPEAGGDAALLVPPGDVEALAASIQRALRLSREELARGPAHSALFTWAETAAKTVAAYRLALQRAAGGAGARAAAPTQRP